MKPSAFQTITMMICILVIGAIILNFIMYCIGL